MSFTRQLSGLGEPTKNYVAGGSPRGLGTSSEAARPGRSAACSLRLASGGRPQCLPICMYKPLHSACDLLTTITRSQGRSCGNGKPIYDAFKQAALRELKR
jgi:hypothetical protein